MGSDGRKTRLKNVVSGTAAVIGLLLVYIAVFSATGLGLPCPFRAVTGLMCPGCGMTHALDALVRGDVRSAVQYNVLSISLVPALAVYLVCRAAAYIRKGTEDFANWEIILLLCSLAVCIIFFLKRNHFI